MKAASTLICSRCVVDATVPGATFDAKGQCNYCSDYEARCREVLYGKMVVRHEALARLVAQVREAGNGRPYDCIVGLSGGVDSSWVLVRAVELGLRPLAVHMDNGWNSELAQNNIANLVRILGVDLHTHVIEWEEYRGLMQAFFDADVVDVELLYDNAMIAVNYQQANRFGLKHLLAGTNSATEGMRIPREWNWLKHDKRNIVAIARKFGAPRLETFPSIGTLQFVWYRFIRRIRWVSFLDLLHYDKAEAVADLQQRFGYKPYPYKHYESVFTRFYQGYLLPVKFGIDKRRIHLSTLVVAGQLDRDEALRLLDQNPYPEEGELTRDREYFLKKMGWTAEQLRQYLGRPGVPHDRYGSERYWWERGKAVHDAVQRCGLWKQARHG